MKRDQFSTTLTAFLQGPQPYRHLYLWHGEAGDPSTGSGQALATLLPPGRAESLDVFELSAGLSRHPFAQEEANELLLDALQTRLRDWYRAGAAVHPILVVTGCPLLARYRVSLQPFYEALSDRSMIILVCSAADAAYDPAGRLPGYVHCEPGTTLAYLSRLVEDNHVVEAGS